MGGTGPSDYGYNEYISNNCCSAAKLANWQSSADVVVLADSWSNFLTPWANGQNREAGIVVRVAFANGRPRLQCCPPVPPPGDPNEWTRHSGGSNMLFLDGHVKWDRWERIKRRERGGPYRFHPRE